ncbi:hypothetical protein WICPIJ_003800 [Wickerhamomyces pijperi]|uniref:Uncharacterized protein n=1 Tax=Wickerhamomyces pijperi TaxID=599730 RepID=A0A9P8TNW3_WICPI|nr:hypothetical protein WICPIJ_003800 [Wickerhamomyces pijperi]
MSNNNNNFSIAVPSSDSNINVAPVTKPPQPCDTEELQSKTHTGNFIEVDDESKCYEGPQFWYETTLSDIVPNIDCQGYLENFTSKIVVKPLSIVVVNQNEISTYSKRRYFVKRVFGFEHEADFSSSNAEPSYIYSLFGSMVDGRAGQTDLSMSGGSVYEHETFFKESRVCTKSNFGFISLPVGFFEKDSIFYEKDAECLFKFFQIEHLDEVDKSYSQKIFIITTDLVPDTEVFSDFVKSSVLKKASSFRGHIDHLSRSPAGLVAIIKDTLFGHVGVNDLQALGMEKRVKELSNEVVNILKSTAFADQQKKALIHERIDELTYIGTRAAKCYSYLNHLTNHVVTPLLINGFMALDVLPDSGEKAGLSQNQKKKLMKQNQKQLRKMNAKKPKDKRSNSDPQESSSKKDSVDIASLKISGSDNDTETFKKDEAISTSEAEAKSEAKKSPQILRILPRENAFLACREETTSMEKLTDKFKALENLVSELMVSEEFKGVESVGVEISDSLNCEIKRSNTVHLDALKKINLGSEKSQKLLKDLQEGVQRNKEALENPGIVKQFTTKMELEFMNELREAHMEVEIAERKQKSMEEA